MDNNSFLTSRWARSIWWCKKKQGIEEKICWQKTALVDFLLTQWWSFLGLAGIPTSMLYVGGIWMIVRKLFEHTDEKWQSCSPCNVLPIAELAADCSVKSTGSYIQNSTSPHHEYNNLDRIFKKTFKSVQVTQIATVQKQNEEQSILMTTKQESKQKEVNETRTCPWYNSSQKGEWNRRAMKGKRRWA